MLHPGWQIPMFRFRPIFTAFLLGATPLALWAGLLVNTRAADGPLEKRLGDALQSADADADKALRLLDALVVEATQRGDASIQVRAELWHARITLDQHKTAGVLDELDNALTTARQAGLTSAEPDLYATRADYFEFLGKPEQARPLLDRAIQLALATSQIPLAREMLDRLAALQEKARQTHLRTQTLARASLLVPDASQPAAELQPLEARVSVENGELGRTRLVLANPSSDTVTGTLSLDAPGTTLGRPWEPVPDQRLWATDPDSHHILLTPSAKGTGSFGKKITLRPGEQVFLYLEVNPPSGKIKNAVQPVTATWRDDDATTPPAQSRLNFEFSSTLPDVSVASSSHIRLSPYYSVPLYAEVYHRGSASQRVEDVVAKTSVPCLVEVYDEDTRELLAVDNEGDGDFFGPADRLLSDFNHDHLPDVVFSAADQKSVSSLEFRLFPAPFEDPADPAASTPLDITLWLHDRRDWQPAATSQADPAAAKN